MAHFYFHGNLNDFLLKSRRHTWIAYTFNGIPSLKDAMEALGVPHVEVGPLVVNDMPAEQREPLRPGDRVQVSPMSHEQIHHHLQYPPTFVVDVNAGSLAKTLRMLGFDTAFDNALGDATIAAIAREENRIVLTRDIALLKHKIIEQGYWLRSQVLKEQLREVILRYDLRRFLDPFSRCIACNGLIFLVDKAVVLDQLPPKVKECYDQFFQCSHCKNVYWKGTHYERMTEFINELPLR